MTNRLTEVSRLSWAEVCARRLDRQALSIDHSFAEQRATVTRGRCHRV